MCRIYAYTLKCVCSQQSAVSAKTNNQPNVGKTLGHRLRRWPNVVPTLGEHLVFAGVYGLLIKSWRDFVTSTIK